MAPVKDDLIDKLPLELRHQILENVDRKDFTEEELAAIQKKIRDSGALDEQGKRTDLKGGETSTQIAQKSEEKRGVYKKIGSLFGESDNTVRKRIEIVEAAEENPEEYSDLEKAMEERSVYSAYSELERRKDIKDRRERLEGTPELENLLLGDCVERIEDVPESSVDCVIADPPYGGVEKLGMRQQLRDYVRDGTYDHPNDDESIFGTLNSLLKKLKEKLKVDAHVYIFTRWNYWPRLIATVEPHLEIKNRLIWDKKAGGLSGGSTNYTNRVEDILFAINGGRRKIAEEGSNPENMLEHPRLHEKQHPTQKPVPLMEELIGNSTVEGESVLAPFAGSGATLVAAERLNRCWTGIELEERWHNLAKERILREREGGPE